MLRNTTFAVLNRERMEEIITKDSNGNILKDGDSVKLIKDLKVKGSSITLKRGTVVKNIKLTDDPEEVDCRVEKMGIVLRTEFLAKA
jgi:alkylphosphonate utilization operon protein PhnA